MRKLAPAPASLPGARAGRNSLGREAQQFWADGCLRTENCAFSIGRLLRKTRFRLVLGFLSSHLTRNRYWMRAGARETRRGGNREDAAFGNRIQGKIDGVLYPAARNGLTLGSIYGLIAIGYTMVYGIIGMINFAHGDIFMLGAFAALIVFLILTSFIAGLPVVLAAAGDAGGRYADDQRCGTGRSSAWPTGRCAAHSAWRR
jgi:hypothetical protein